MESAAVLNFARQFPQRRYLCSAVARTLFKYANSGEVTSIDVLAGLHFNDELEKHLPEAKLIYSPAQGAIHSSLGLYSVLAVSFPILHQIGHVAFVAQVDPETIIIEGESSYNGVRTVTSKEFMERAIKCRHEVYEFVPSQVNLRV